MDQLSTSTLAYHPTRSRVTSGKIVIYALLVFWSLVCMFPLYWVAVTSLKGEAEIMDGPRYLPFVDFVPSADAWVFVFAYSSDNLMWRYFNSTVIGLASTALTILLASLAVYGLTRFRPARPWMGLGNRGILFGILSTRLLPPVIIVLPIYMIAHFTGTLDTRFALVVAYTTANLPVAVWLLQPLFGEAMTEQEESAQLEGASYLEIFFTIFLPMVAAGIATVALLIFILCWNEYLFAAYLAGNNAMTLPPFLVGQMSIKEAQVGGEAEEWARFSAATLVMIMPLLACTVFAQRLLSRVALWRR
jgi:multiple sugar transport system permease protein